VRVVGVWGRYVQTFLVNFLSVDVVSASTDVLQKIKNCQALLSPVREKEKM
jgi:hypothetical protein